MTYHQSRGQRLKSLIEWFATTNPYDKPNDEQFERYWTEAMDQLSRLAPDTLTQEMVAKRWPRLLTMMMTRSNGYFTAQSAANALICHKIGRAFGCEMYCAYAGFERDGWPSDPKVYDGKLKETNRRFILSSFASRHSLREHRAEEITALRTHVTALALGRRVRELAAYF